MSTILGIDEAGRGPVIGPLVMCGVVIDTQREQELKELGVTDSKLLSAQRRENLEPLIKQIALAYEIIAITPEEIDARFEKGLTLNTLEAQKSAEIIKKLKPTTVILDCPSTNPKTYVTDIYARIGGVQTEIFAEYKADVKYIVVAAASILAKVERDRQIELLKKQIGIDFGSGYPSDPKTQAFLATYHADFPIFRKSWDSWKKIAQKQTDLGDFA